MESDPVKRELRTSEKAAREDSRPTLVRPKGILIKVDDELIAGYGFRAGEIGDGSGEVESEGGGCVNGCSLRGQGKGIGGAAFLKEMQVGDDTAGCSCGAHGKEETEVKVAGGDRPGLGEDCRSAELEAECGAGEIDSRVGEGAESFDGYDAASGESPGSK